MKILIEIDTWAYFEAKHLEHSLDYEWSKINMFTQWRCSTNQTALLFFDPTKQVDHKITGLEPDPSCFQDPFWIYTHIMDEVSNLQDSAVWAIRNQVRGIETQEQPKGKPQPDYRRLHDIARHAIHVTEALDVSLHTLDHILRHHMRYTGQTDPPQKPNAFQDVRSRLEFAQSCLNSLRQRSISNEKRLQNEIQLTFNTVAQHDAGVTVKISQAMMSDSTALKTLAFVTFAFLPPTFICSVFSMSFFNYSADAGWTVSKDIWIYWAFAVPTTVVTTLLWHYWHKFIPRERVERKTARFSLRQFV